MGHRCCLHISQDSISKSKRYTFNQFRWLSQFSLLPAGLLLSEAPCELIGQCVLLSSPEKVRGLSWLAVLLSINKEGAELDGQSRPDQADPSFALWAGVVNSSTDRMHVQRLWAERGAQLLGPAAVRQQLLIPRDSLQQVGEDHRTVVAAQEVPLPATQGQEGEVLFIAPALIWTQPTEEEDQELFIFEAGDKVLHFCAIEEKLSLVVNVVEVFSDTWFRALALDVCSGGSGGDAAGGQAAQSGQTSAAESCSTEEQHARTGAPESETTTSVLTESVYLTDVTQRKLCPYVIVYGWHRAEMQPGRIQLLHHRHFLTAAA